MARECWECNEVVTGDHYQSNCPKRKKKDDEARPMTPYPRRDGYSSKDRNSATQGHETFRRFHAYIGTGPWKLLVQGEAAPEPESVDGPESETESAQEPESKDEPEPETEPEPESEDEPEPETKSAVEPEGAAGPQSECGPEPESIAGAPEGSALGQTDDTTNMADPEVESKREKDLEDDMRAKLEEEELILDETVEKMMNMEIN